MAGNAKGNGTGTGAVIVTAQLTSTTPDSVMAGIPAS